MNVLNLVREHAGHALPASKLLLQLVSHASNTRVGNLFSGVRNLRARVSAYSKVVKSEILAEKSCRCFSRHRCRSAPHRWILQTPRK